MSTLPTTTACYERRIAELQGQIQTRLDQLRRRRCTPHELELIDRQIQPLYAAIWAMHAEIDA